MNQHKEKIVYLLGAGFSAPLGLPVINNFPFKARDQYSIAKTNYSHFREVFNSIDDMSRAKNYINLDLFNIEEILSLLEMQDFSDASKRSEEFQRFVKDVIDFHTPELEVYESPFQSKQNSFHILFSNHSLWRTYIGFIANLLSLRFTQLNEETVMDDFPASQILAESNLEADVDYAVVTLNYDMVVEKSVEYIKDNFCAGQILELEINKLHGSIDSEIIPPTWKKVMPKSVTNAWTNSQKLLQQANQIRILGYSLPLSDVYVKYLFSTSLLEVENLRQIDVICLDESSEVKKRYDSLITFPRYRFKNGDILDYLSSCTNIGGGSRPLKYQYNRLEKIHKAFMEEV